MKRVLLVTDNDLLLSRFKLLIEKNALLIEKEGFAINYAYSKKNTALSLKYGKEEWISPIDIKIQVDEIISKYNIIISLHCKQLFPASLVQQVRCINVHPGLNPHNRGWFPQVFSIINGLPVGASIHEIDEQLDHGPLICQKEVKIESWDTSLTVYTKVLDAEIELLDQYLMSILCNTYSTQNMEEGNLNLKTDFDKLCQLDLTEIDSLGNHINKLRALTHGHYSNAYFTDADGEKIYVSINLHKH